MDKLESKSKQSSSTSPTRSSKKGGLYGKGTEKLNKDGLKMEAKK